MLGLVVEFVFIILYVRLLDEMCGSFLQEYSTYASWMGKTCDIFAIKHCLCKGHVYIHELIMDVASPNIFRVSYFSDGARFHPRAVTVFVKLLRIRTLI